MSVPKPQNAFFSEALSDSDSDGIEEPKQTLQVPAQKSSLLAQYQDMSSSEDSNDEEEALPAPTAPPVVVPQPQN